MKKGKRLFILTALLISVVFICHFGSLQAATLEWSGEVKVNLEGADSVPGDPDMVSSKGSSSRVALDEVVLNLKAEVVENVTATAVVKYEENELFLDEGYLSLAQFANQPMELIAGKRVLPFGVFNSHLVSDPLTKDKYEINAAGLTLAFSQEALQGMGFSLSVYSDPESQEDDLGDFILNVCMAPTDLFNFSVYFDSAQGVEDRNNTAGLSLGVVVENLTVDAEYITALERDSDQKETAYSLAGAYQLLPTFEAALRYEGYDDDTGTDEFFDEETFQGLESRLSAGFNYGLYEHTTLGAEYRISSYEKGDDANEWVLQLKVEF